MNFTEARSFREGDLPRWAGHHANRQPPHSDYAENYRLRNLLAKNDASGIPS